MKVFLKKDVSGVGTANEVVDVADGYARNYLLPQGLGVKATAGEVKVAKQYAESQALRVKRARERAEKLAALLSEKVLYFKVKAGETGRLYGSITSSDIVDRSSTSTPSSKSVHASSSCTGAGWIRGGAAVPSV